MGNPRRALHEASSKRPYIDGKQGELISGALLGALMHVVAEKARDAGRKPWAKLPCLGGLRELCSPTACALLPTGKSLFLDLDYRLDIVRSFV
jgi:hypothetical protein